MSFEQILSDIEQRRFKPVYLLSGEQTYYIDEITKALETMVLDEAERDFNQTVIYGRDTDPKTIISYAKRFPMMAEYQVVIVKEAQDIKDITELEPYIKSPLESTILVIAYKYKKVDKRTTFVKSVKKSGVFFESPQVRDYQIPDWITAYLKKKEYSIMPRESALLADHLGNNLSKIVNELNKLCINISAGNTISADDIEKNIGISKEFNIFEYQNALGERNKAKATQIANYFASNEKDSPLPMITAVLFGYFLKIGLYHELQDKSKHSVASALSINPFFVRDYEKACKNYSRKGVARVISLLREYDLKSKGIGVGAATTGGELMRELNFRILAQA